MIYDPKRRAYIEKGHILTPQEIRDRIETYIDSEKKEVDRQSALLLAGAITIAAFFEFMREKVSTWHSVTGVIAYGGNSQMNVERWKRINEKVQSELRYLAGFEKVAEHSMRKTESVAAQIAKAVEANPSVPAGLESVVEERALAAVMEANAADRSVAVADAIKDALADSIGQEEAATVAAEVVPSVWDELLWGQLESRGRMYADAAYSTFANNEKASAGDVGLLRGRRICAEDDASCDECDTAATDEYLSLDEITDIGDATCMSNCRCVIEFEYAGIPELEIDRELYA